MDTADWTTDMREIEDLVARQFASLNWSPDTSADWSGFTADFLPGATLYPSARPAKAQSVDAFVKRLSGLEGSELRSFHERVLGTEVRVYGNVAVAAAGCETVENGSDTSRGVEMLLLVKDEGRWRIVAQAWDSESADSPLPAELAGRPAASD